MYYAENLVDIKYQLIPAKSNGCLTSKHAVYHSSAHTKASNPSQREMRANTKWTVSIEMFSYGTSGHSTGL